MAYQTVFDVVQTGYRQWWFPAGGLVFVGITAALVRHYRRTGPLKQLVLSGVGLGFAVLWTMFSFLATLNDYVRLASALSGGYCEVAEGPVTDFRPTPDGGHASESFVVDGQRFTYSDYVVTAGFNNTASHGGPVAPGRWVRVTYYGGEIAKLEVAP